MPSLDQWISSGSCQNPDLFLLFLPSVCSAGGRNEGPSSYNTRIRREYAMAVMSGDVEMWRW
jgi:hypothetical protein